MKITNKKVWLGVLLLITIDQGIKIVISNNFFDKRFAILPPMLYFEPMFNRHYSWFNSMFRLGVGKWIHITIVATLTILIFLYYQYLHKQLGGKIILDVMFAFIFSGAICSLVDKVFWNGSLDYILVKGFFTFDLKDVYINIFIGLLLLSSLFENSLIKQINGITILDHGAEKEYSDTAEIRENRER